jgi:hypothetical protein
MAIKMKKGDLIIAFTIIALVSTGLLSSCQMGYGDEEEEEELTGLPVASIVDSTGAQPEPGKTFGNYQFSLEWQGYSDDVNSSANIETLKDTYKKWKEYESFVDARPFYPPSGGTIEKDYKVWTTDATPLLKNYTSGKQLVIQRYWSPAWGTLNKANWTTHLVDRKTAFEAAKEQIEKQIAQIKESDFYGVKDSVTNKYPLHDLADAMQAFIKVPATAPYTDRGAWEAADRNGEETIWNTAKTGPLYELYFGHIPETTEYVEPGHPVVW